MHFQLTLLRERLVTVTAGERPFTRVHTSMHHQLPSTRKPPPTIPTHMFLSTSTTALSHSRSTGAVNNRPHCRNRTCTRVRELTRGCQCWCRPVHCSRNNTARSRRGDGRVWGSSFTRNGCSSVNPTSSFPGNTTPPALAWCRCCRRALTTALIFSGQVTSTTAGISKRGAGARVRRMKQQNGRVGPGRFWGDSVSLACVTKSLPCAAYYPRRQCACILVPFRLVWSCIG